MADMRVARTKGYLRTALMDVLRLKPFDEVTVREVTEKAQVSRNSFYNHYADLASLAEDCYLHEVIFFHQPYKRLRDYACRHDACTETLDEHAHILVFFRNNPHLARTILDNVCTSPYYAECLNAQMDLLLDHVVTEYGTSCSPYIRFEDCVRYIACGMFGQMRDWFLQGMQVPIEDETKELVYFALQSTAGVACHRIEEEYLQAIEDWHFNE